jgi:dihydrodipicolinate synthase/N-acetylneuraminate lyase
VDESVKPSELKERLVGVIAFCPTPFGADGALVPDDLALQVEFLAASGAAAIVVSGGVGEFYALDEAEHRTVVETAVHSASGRVPVIVGIGAATRTAGRLAAHAAEAGADGILVNPLHFVRPSRRGLRAHYAELAAASGLGLIAFAHHQAVYDLETLLELVELDEMIGVKDEYSDLRAFARARGEIGSRLAWINGVGEALAAPYFGAGAQAFTSGIINFAPALTLAVWTAGAEGRLDDLRALVEAHVQPITDLRARPGYSTTVIKEAMNLCGRPGGSVRAPLVPLEPHEREELAAIIAALPSPVGEASARA